jgi:hypothetical protein
VNHLPPTLACPRREEVADVYSTPLLDLLYNAASVHRMYNDPSMVQRCTLLSIKTGGCPETCTYCSQSSSWSKTTGTKAEKLMELEDVYEAALRAKASGSTRFCMGAAWRGPSQVGKGQWTRVLEMVKRIRALDMEVRGQGRGIRHIRGWNSDRTLCRMLLCPLLSPVKRWRHPAPATTRLAPTLVLAGVHHAGHGDARAGCRAA